MQVTEKVAELGFKLRKCDFAVGWALDGFTWSGGGLEAAEANTNSRDL